MYTYQIQRAKKEKISFSDAVWTGCTAAKVDRINWKEWEYAPKTECKMIANEDGIYVKFLSDEIPYSIYREFNGHTCRDSCVELFINFSPAQCEEYLNFEVNSDGVMYLGFGKAAERGPVADVDPGIFRIEAEPRNDGWGVMFFIPFSFVQRFYGETIGNRFAGNLYKCGNRTPKPHYLSWAPIDIAKPDFHRPDYFGEFKMMEAVIFDEID